MIGAQHWGDIDRLPTKNVSINAKHIEGPVNRDCQKEKHATQKKMASENKWIKRWNIFVKDCGLAPFKSWWTFKYQLLSSTSIFCFLFSDIRKITLGILIYSTYLQWPRLGECVITYRALGPSLIISFLYQPLLVTNITNNWGPGSESHGRRRPVWTIRNGAACCSTYRCRTEKSSPVWWWINQLCNAFQWYTSGIFLVYTLA